MAASGSTAPPSPGQRLLSLPTSALPPVFDQKEKASSGFCPPPVVTTIQKCPFASYRRDNSSLRLPDFDKHSVSQNDTTALPRQFRLVNFDLIVNDLYTPRTQDNFLAFSNKYNHLQVYKPLAPTMCTVPATDKIQSSISRI